MLSINSCRVRRFTLIVAVILAAAIGSMASTIASTDSWYLLLDKSELNTPSYVFGIVWPILYVLMAVVSFLQAQNIFKLYVMQIILNGLWSWLFFVFQSTAFAFLDIVLLIFLNILILKQLRETNAWISVLLYIPYVFWICFACALNLSILVLN